MIVLRLVLVFLLLAIGSAGLLYLITRDKRYLRFIPVLLKYTVLLLASVAAIWALGRLVVFL